jgi:hypothetical protein
MPLNGIQHKTPSRSDSSVIQKNAKQSQFTAISAQKQKFAKKTNPIQTQILTGLQDKYLGKSNCKNKTWIDRKRK